MCAPRPLPHVRAPCTRPQTPRTDRYVTAESSDNEPISAMKQPGAKCDLCQCNPCQVTLSPPRAFAGVLHHWHAWTPLGELLRFVLAAPSAAAAAAEHTQCGEMAKTSGTGND